MSRARIPVDLILHATSGDLSGIAGNHANRGQPEQAGKALDLSIAISRAISPGAVAEDWMASGDIARDGERLAGIVVASHSTRVPSVGHTRAIEIAVARRLADTACALAITGDAEDTACALALWRAAEAITGMQAPISHNEFPRDLLRACAEEAGRQTGERVNVKTSAAEQAGIIGRALRNAAGNQRAARICEHISAILGDPSGELPARVKALMTERDTAKADADRRLQIILAKDKTDDAIREALGACDGEDSLAAAKRTAKARDDHYENVLRLTGEIKDAQAERDALKGRDPCETCREEARQGRIKSEKLSQTADMACKGRDAAIEARAQMQARLVSVERERDAAQEDERTALGEVASVRAELIEWKAWMNNFPTTCAGQTWEQARKAMTDRHAEELKSAQEEAATLRRKDANTITIGINIKRSVDDAWHGLMSGPLHGGRWTLETSAGLLRMRWPNGIVEALVEPRHEDAVEGFTPARA